MRYNSSQITITSRERQGPFTVLTDDQLSEHPWMWAITAEQLLISLSIRPIGELPDRKDRHDLDQGSTSTVPAGHSMRICSCPRMWSTGGTDMPSRRHALISGQWPGRARLSHPHRLQHEGHPSRRQIHLQKCPQAKRRTVAEGHPRAFLGDLVRRRRGRDQRCAGASGLQLLPPPVDGAPR